MLFLSLRVEAVALVVVLQFFEEAFGGVIDRFEEVHPVAQGDELEVVRQARIAASAVGGTARRGDAEDDALGGQVSVGVSEKFPGRVRIPLSLIRHFGDARASGGECCAHQLSAFQNLQILFVEEADQVSFSLGANELDRKGARLGRDGIFTGSVAEVAEKREGAVAVEDVSLLAAEPFYAREEADAPHGADAKRKGEQKQEQQGLREVRLIE